MRLIDADALIEQMEEDMEHMEEPLAKMFTGAAISDIKHAPTVEAPDINGGNMDAISRQAAIRWVKQECNPFGKPTLDFESGKRVMEHLERMPSVQPERKTGRWIPCPQNASWLYVYKCSECGGYLQISDVDGIGITAKYCSYCGTKMEGGEQE